MLSIFCAECEGTAVEKLKTLCELPGVSGREDAVRDYIVEQIKDKLMSYKLNYLLYLALGIEL